MAKKRNTSKKAKASNIFTSQRIADKMLTETTKSPTEPSTKVDNAVDQSIDKAPAIAVKFIKDGYEYLGVNSAGEHFVRNDQGIWRIAMPKGTQLDYMGEGLPKAELKKLKK